MLPRRITSSPVVKMGALILAVIVAALVLPTSQRIPETNVSFIGNSITFSNDLPRFFQAIAGGKVSQNSCLHGGLSLQTIMRKGNGMYNKWRTTTAEVPDLNLTNYGNAPVYDFGACSVRQLLFGQDDNLLYDDGDDDDNDYYINDGRNPCFQDPYYLEYMEDRYNAPDWDYIVVNDKTSYPGDYNNRQLSMNVLEQVYVGMIQDLAPARPVLLALYGYKKNEDYIDDDSYGIDMKIPEFTSRVYHGYQQYAALLSDSLPADQSPLLAPIGLAFLLLWEESYGMWEKLFIYDGMHPSPHGTYLMGCVLFATIFDRMPPSKYALPKDMDTVWSTARRMVLHSSDSAAPYPTRDEANYLFRVAERVVLEGVVPNSFIDEETISKMELSEQNQ